MSIPLPVARRTKARVQLFQTEAHPDDAPDLMLIAVAVMALLPVLQREEEGQQAAIVGCLIGLLRGQRLNRAHKQWIADLLARLSAHLGDACIEVRVEADVSVDFVQGIEIAKCLDTVAPVDLEAADILQLAL